MLIRPCQPGEEALLLQIYRSAIHQLAAPFYTREQLSAWAPEKIEVQKWQHRIQGIQPFVVEIDGQLVAYADVQADGYIDHFFVACNCGRQGVGSALLRHLELHARQRGCTELSAHVSLSAEAFFSRNGFQIVARQKVEMRGVILEHARMQKIL